jgi:hypothetical protein
VASSERRISASSRRTARCPAQQWTNRNWTIRGLTALGSVGAGFVFPFSGDVAKGIAAYNGVLVPGASTLWPDATVGQLNRISDFGFQTNKLVPKEASDIVVAFFPIERFLTPSFKKEFIRNPAGFFVPGEMLADPKMYPRILPVLVPLIKAIEGSDDRCKSGNPGGATTAKADVEAATRVKILQSLLMHCSGKEEINHQGGEAETQSANTSCAAVRASKDCKIQDLINRISLNSIRLVIGGVMSVNVSSVPPSIFEVDFDDNGPDIWSKPGTKRGTILGTYLSGGNPVIVDDQGKAIDGVTIKGVTQGSDDRELRFEMTLAKCIPPSTQVRFQVNKPSDAELAQGTKAEAAGTELKPANKGAGVSSMLFDYPLSGYTCSPPDAAPGEGGTAEQGAPNAGEKPGNASPAAPPNHPVPVTPAAKPQKKEKGPTRQ